MNTSFITRGFSLIEILVVIAIIGLLGALSAVGFKSMYESATLRAGAGEVFGALTTARAKTLASDGDQVHGVHISHTEVTRFEGDTYISGASENKVYAFEGGIRATSTLISAGGIVLFERLTGKPNTTAIIYVYDIFRSATTTIILHGSGLVEYE